MRARTLLLVMLSTVLAMQVQAGTLRLVTGDGYAPYTGKTLPAYGMLSKLVRRAFVLSGLDTQLYWRPWNRGYLNTLMLDYDATFPYIYSAERAQDFLYSEPLYVGQQYIFSRAGEEMPSDDLNALAGKRLCYPLGWQPPEAINRMIEAGQMHRHSPMSLNECARLLLLGRDDLFLADQHIGDSALKLSGVEFSQFSRSAKPINRNNLHLIVSRKHPKAQWLIDQFNRGLAQMRASGEYQQLVGSYLLPK